MRRILIPSGVKIFAFVWLGVLLVPPLREMSPINSFIASQSVASVDAEALARRFPDDPRVLALQIQQDNFQEEDAGSATRRIKRQSARYDALIKRFPRENWLRAERLFLGMGRSIDMDFEGAPQRQKRVLDPQILQSNLQVALDGQKIEPDNAFFGWMQAVFRFGLRQNDAGVAALQRAARAPRFEDYVRFGVRQRLDVMALQRPLLFEEKLGVYYSILLSHYSKMQDARKAALQVALDAQKRGDNKRAVEIIDAIVGAAGVFRHDADLLIRVLVSDTMTRESLEAFNVANGFKKQKIDMSLEQRRQYSIELARDFGLSARRVGRADIAERAFKVAQAPLAVRNDYFTADWDELGLRAPWSRIALQGVWSVVMMAVVAWLFAALWAASRVGLGLWERKNEGGEAAIPARGQIARSANFSVWAMLGYGAVAFFFGVGFWLGEEVGWVPSLEMTTQEMFRDLLSKSPIYAALGAWILPIGMALWMRKRKWHRPARRIKAPRVLSSRQSALRRALWLATLVFAAMSYFNGYGLWDGTIFQWPRPLILAAICGVGAIFNEFRLGLPIFWPRFGRLEKQRQPQPFLFAARLASSSAGVLAVVWSLFFLASALGMWPLRAQLNRSLERRMAVGELEWTRQQSAARK